ncbi:hypothetical protein Q671_17390 [Halomonas sp. PBN3]|nr:hypothetical protein Q671_17390 [Halomonas sp. PBN3]
MRLAGMLGSLGVLAVIRPSLRGVDGKLKGKAVYGVSLVVSPDKRRN